MILVGLVLLPFGMILILVLLMKAVLALAFPRYLALIRATHETYCSKTECLDCSLSAAQRSSAVLKIRSIWPLAAI